MAVGAKILSCVIFLLVTWKYERPSEQITDKHEFISKFRITDECAVDTTFGHDLDTSNVNFSANSPDALHVQKVEYPPEAIKLNLQGVVRVEAFVDSMGAVRFARVRGIHNKIFNRAALESIIRWTFQPSLVRGKPTGVWIMIPMRFELPKYLR